MASTRTTLRVGGTAVRALLVLTVVLGIGYPLAVTAVGQVSLPWQANGSLVTDAGHPVGSALIGQSFAGDPKYFQSRPSAVKYDGMSSGGSNLGPNNPDLVAAIAERKAAVAAADGTGTVPADAVTASGSGLDPDISPEYALLQVDAVAAARGMDAATVRSLVESKIQSRDLGFLGDPRVNVLDLNRALDAVHR